MSRTAPTDLAVTFRSIPRRLREALGDDAATSDLDRPLSEAGALLHTSADPEAIAAAIEAMPADSWDQSTLDSLRATASSVGATLRNLASRHQQLDDD